MNMSFTALPEGRPGQALALLLALLGLAALWLGAIAPACDWFSGRQALLALESQELARGEALRESLPALRAAAAASEADGAGILLAGGSDAIAGANLQSALQGLAAQAGANFDSIAMAPVQTAGTLRRVGVQVSVTATWPVLVALLNAIDTARPRMIVDQLTVTSPGETDPREDAPLQAGFTVTAFRAGPP